MDNPVRKEVLQSAVAASLANLAGVGCHQPTATEGMGSNLREVVLGYAREFVADGHRVAALFALESPYLTDDDQQWDPASWRGRPSWVPESVPLGKEKRFLSEIVASGQPPALSADQAYLVRQVIHAGMDFGMEEWSMWQFVQQLPKLYDYIRTMPANPSDWPAEMSAVALTVQCDKPADGSSPRILDGPDEHRRYIENQLSERRGKIGDDLRKTAKELNVDEECIKEVFSMGQSVGKDSMSRVFEKVQAQDNRTTFTTQDNRTTFTTVGTAIGGGANPPNIPLTP